MNAMKIKSIYRSLYRELSSQYLTIAKEEAGKKFLKAQALNAYRSKNGSPGTSLPRNPQSLRISDYPSEQLRSIFSNSNSNDTEYALEALEYLKNQHKYKVLLARYNPSLTMDEEEKVRLSARKVGLELPEEIEPSVK